MRLQISSAKIFSCCLAARKWPTTDPLVPQGWHWVVDSISFWVDFTNILQGYFAVTGTIMRLTQCKSPIWYGWITHIDPIGTRYTTSPRQSTSKPRAYLMEHTAPWIRLDPGVRPSRHIYFIKSYFCQHVFPITAKLVNSLRPSDAYMRQKPNPSLIQIMARRHSAPSHYLNQWWNIVNWTLGNMLQWNVNRNSYIFIRENAFENVVWKM